MDLLRDAPNETEKLSSMEEMYTDFDQWIVKFKKIYSRSNPDSDTRKEIHNNVHQISVHEILIQGLFVKKIPSRLVINQLRTVFDEHDNFVSMDNVIYEFLKKNKYMMSKL